MLYPGNIKKDYHKSVSYANRGMDLEKIIDEANKYYLTNNLGVIYKRPTPIAIESVKYTENKIMTSGYLKSKSTLDYVGLFKGKYLDFDAKSTMSKTSFPLSNIHNHQLKHIKNIIDHGGISFLIIEMNGMIFLLKGEDLISFIDSNSRKSIPFKYLEEIGIIIKFGYNPALDYLKIVNDEYFKEALNEKKEN